MAKKPLEIDMIAGSQLRDTQGEMLSVEGADISDLEAGRGRLNDNHGKGFFNSIGRVTLAKKIFKEEDCKDDERLKHYWDKVKAPYIYVKGILYDDEDHPNAKAAAAILRNIHKADTPLQLKASVEGGVVSRGIADQSLLARTKIHSIALTFTPANNNTLVEPTSLDKSFHDEAADMQLIKSVTHLAQTNVPSFRHIVRDASAEKVHENLVKIFELAQHLGLDNDIYIPSKQEIIQRSLEEKISGNVIKIHELVKYLSENTEPELEKANIKGAMLGAAMAAGLAGSPTVSQAQQTQRAPSMVQPMKTNVDNALPEIHQKVYKQVSKQYPLLGAIGAVESSGGKNYNHKTVEAPGSLHSGHTAGGMFGMMPNTAAYTLKNDPALAKKYPKLAEAAQDMKKNHKQFTEIFNNDPQAAADFAVAFYKRNKSRTKNEQMLAHAWNGGLKGTWNKYKEGGQPAIDSNPYVKNVMTKYLEFVPKKSQSKQHVKKALTAGYGGAGAPTSNVGGGVFQAEALDSGRKEATFKYLTCDHCGKEQVHAKYQVKCRECGHSLSLEKLYSLLGKS